MQRIRRCLPQPSMEPEPRPCSQVCTRAHTIIPVGLIAIPVMRQHLAARGVAAQLGTRGAVDRITAGRWRVLERISAWITVHKKLVWCLEYLVAVVTFRRTIWCGDLDGAHHRRPPRGRGLDSVPLRGPAIARPRRSALAPSRQGRCPRTSASLGTTIALGVGVRE
jgi:hypothetical protein